MTEKQLNTLAFWVFVGAMVLSLVLVFFYLNDPIGITIGFAVFIFSLVMVLLVTNQKEWNDR